MRLGLTRPESSIWENDSAIPHSRSYRKMHVNIRFQRCPAKIAVLVMRILISDIVGEVIISVYDPERKAISLS